MAAADVEQRIGFVSLREDDLLVSIVLYAGGLVDPLEEIEGRTNSSLFACHGELMETTMPNATNLDATAFEDASRTPNRLRAALLNIAHRSWRMEGVFRSATRECAA
jgi:hypothetical protein